MIAQRSSQEVLKHAKKALRLEPWQVGLAAGALLLALLALPVAALVLKVSPGVAASYLGQPSVLATLGLSLTTSVISVIVVLALGTPLAYALARHRFTGRALVEALVHMPLVLPPAVAGLALLLVFGRRGWLGAPLGALGIEVSFTAAAVVIAQTFVAAPFFVRAAQASFRQVDPSLEGISLTLGVSHARTFWRVTLPLALPGLINGAAMAWARALGEFGATIMFAGNLPGRTQTLPLAVYSTLQTDLDGAIVLSTLLLVVSLLILALLHAYGRDRNGA